jgi:hypothetical protein
MQTTTNLPIPDRSSGYEKIPRKSSTYILHPETGKTLPSVTDQTVVIFNGYFIQVMILYN